MKSGKLCVGNGESVRIDGLLMVGLCFDFLWGADHLDFLERWRLSKPARDYCAFQLTLSVPVHAAFMQLMVERLYS